MILYKCHGIPFNILSAFASQMNKIFSFSIIVMAACFFCSMLVMAMPVEDVKLDNFVKDYTSTLSSEEVSTLTAIATSLREAGAVELAIVLVDDFDGLSKEEYALAIAHGNLGDTKEDNGLLVLVGIAEREYRIEVGYGLEGSLNDAKVGRLARGQMVPSFKDNRFGQGLILFSSTIHQELLPGVPLGVEVPEQPQKQQVDPQVIFVAILFGFFLLRGLIAVLSSGAIGKRRGRSGDDLFTGAMLASVFLRGGRGGFGGGFGGGGFGGFGGGGFGGGGSGGSF